MSTAEAEALEPEDDVSAADVPADTEEAASEAPSAEERALRTGWKPLDQFKGDPAKWIDAETFVKRAEEDPAIVHATNRQLQKALDLANKRFETRVGQLEDTLSKFAAHHSKSEQRQYERAMRDLQAKQDAAVEANDLATVRETTEEITALTVEAKGGAKEPKAPADPPELADWKADNSWFGKDRVLSAAAGAIIDDLLSEDPTANLTRQLKAVDKRIREEFPHKFENPNRKAPSPVAGATPPKAAGKTFADLPADAKQMCTQFERDIKGFKREQYVKDYFAS